MLVDEIDNLLKHPEYVQNYINKKEQKKYGTSLAVEICKKVCPCCNRNCDIDMQK